MSEIIITNHSHPHYGAVGTLTDETLPTGQQVVQLYNGSRCGVDSTDYKPMTALEYGVKDKYKPVIADAKKLVDGWFGR